MAGRTVKFPLEVKNGTQARNMTDLVNNFDIEKIIGYFLDGRLKSWLEARYYEEEAIAIENIDKDDPDLAKKLSEVFGVAYNETVIDPEKIERQNARITKLKQITSDEEIIRNVDLVAFDQEELADLYDSGKKKIYLCEGEFNIPKSKQNIDYVFIGDPKVNGLHSQTNSLAGSGFTDADSDEDSMTHESPLTEDDITEDLANFIGEHDYVITTDYVVFKTFDNHLTVNPPHFMTNNQLNVSDKFERGSKIFGCWSRKDGKIKSFKLDGYSDYEDFLGTIRNKIVLRGSSQSELGVLLYDLETKTSNVICTDWNADSSSFSTSNNCICYQDNSDNIKMYDIAADQYKTVVTLDYETAVCLAGSTLWYIEKNLIEKKLIRFDLEHNDKRKYDYIDEDNALLGINADTIFANDRFCLICNGGDFGLESLYMGTQTRFYKFSFENSKLEKILSLDGLYYTMPYKKNMKYVVSVNQVSDFPANVIDLETGETFVLCKHLGYTRTETHWLKEDDTYHHAYDISLVGNYLIYEETRGSSTEHYYRINIKNRQKIEISIKKD